jgi:hypothetical protein
VDATDHDDQPLSYSEPYDPRDCDLGRGRIAALQEDQVCAPTPGDAFLARQREVMKREKYQVMNDRDAVAAWLDELLRQFAAEAKRRKMGGA